MSKVLLSDLKEYFPDNQYVLMIGLGFDQRCFSVLKQFPKEKTVRIIGISNAGWSELNRSSLSQFSEIAGNSAVVIGREAKSVLEVADMLWVCIAEIMATQVQTMVIDVTSLSHELLVVLMGILHKLGAMKRVTLLYVGASKYSVNSGAHDVWLSRGVRSIRSVLGFPGTMYPSKKLHLILLAGFEVERAKEVISCYEPSSLSIGKGGREQSVSTVHHEYNQLFFDKLNLFIKEQDTYIQDVQHFEFSCVNPFETKTQLLTYIAKAKEKSDDNFVVCPLNTKLSTIGVALAALENQSIQICYAEPEEYNTDGYSEPSNEVTIVSLDNA